MKKKIIIILPLISFLLICFYFFSQVSYYKYFPRNINPIYELTIATKFEDVKFKVDIADNKKTRTLGLSNTQSLERNHGLYFVFEEPQKVSFWMKDMNYNIDILFIDENKKIVEIFENVTKESYNAVSPEKSGVILSAGKIKYVLEIPSFESKNNGIEVGDTVKIGN